MDIWKMQKLIVRMAFLAGTFVSLAHAAPTIYTLPATTLTDSSTISGSFTYDPVTYALSSINIIQTGGLASTFNVPGASDQFYIRGSSAASGPTPGIYIEVGSLPNSSVGVGVCEASDFTLGVCQNVSGDASGSYLTGTGTISTAPSVNLTYAAPSPTGSGTVNSEISGGGAGCGFASSTYQTAASVAAAPPANLAFPHGVLNFTTTACQSGGTIDVTITYPQALPSGTRFYKYGPASPNAIASWYEHPAVVLGNTISYSVTDGQQGDGNNAAGVITDPGGAAVPLAASGAQAIPTLSEWAVLMLSGLTALAAMFAFRRRI